MRPQVSRLERHPAGSLFTQLHELLLQSTPTFRLRNKAAGTGNCLALSTLMHAHQKGKSFISSSSEAHTSHPGTTKTTPRLEILPECQQVFQDVALKHNYQPLLLIHGRAASQTAVARQV